MKVRGIRLTDGTVQIGYKNERKEWLALTNLIRHRRGWVSDNYTGWHKTITMWKNRIEDMLKSEAE